MLVLLNETIDFIVYLAWGFLLHDLQDLRNIIFVEWIKLSRIVIRLSDVFPYVLREDYGVAEAPYHPNEGLVEVDPYRVVVHDVDFIYVHDVGIPIRGSILLEEVNRECDVPCGEWDAVVPCGVFDHAKGPYKAV